MSKNFKPEWTWYPEPCKKCGKRMIQNRRYIECGEMFCDYIKITKIPDHYFTKIPQTLGRSNWSFYRGKDVQ